MSEPRQPSLQRFWTPSLRKLIVVGIFVGFGEYSAVAALADVAKYFGHVASTTSVASVVGLSGSVLGLGLAIFRLSSLAALPLTALADRWGRQRTLQYVVLIGLLCTVVAAGSPNYWFFVGCFAIGRPFLSAALSLLQVIAVEISTAAHRIRHLAFVAAGSGAGAGLAAVLHGVIRGGADFRWLFLLALGPLLVTTRVVRGLPQHRSDEREMRLGRVPVRHRRTLGLVATLTGLVAAIAGTANGFIFVYGESLLRVAPSHLALIVTASGVAGVLGLWVSHFIAKRWGRRRTIVLAISGTAVAACVAYSGGYDRFVAGYLCGVAMGGLLTPALNAIGVELFPKTVRATAAGWIVVATVIGAMAGLVVFGTLVDAGTAASAFRRAALWTFLPVVPLSFVVYALPESAHFEVD